MTLEEVARLRLRVRPPAGGRYRVLTGLVYLTGTCPEPTLDMTLPSGVGTRHAPAVWEVGGDDAAAAALDAVAAGRARWGLLLWVPLMRGGGDAPLIERWAALFKAAVAEPGRRGELAEVALVFAELAGQYLPWERAMAETSVWTESPVVNRWFAQGLAKERVEAARSYLLRLLGRKFGPAVPADLTELLDQQTDAALLQTWFDAATDAHSLDDFRRALRG